MSAKTRRVIEFSPRERLSFWVLVSLLACCLAMVAWIHQPDTAVPVISELPPDTETGNPVVQPSLPVHPGSVVDPNQADLAALCSTGLSERVATNLLRYREKGGNFRSLNDLKKIYGMTDEMLERASPWLIFPDSPEQQFGGRTQQEQVRTMPEEEPAADRFPFDPNQLNQEEWMRLGVPEKAASNAVRYREKGGRFRKAADIGKIYGMPEQLAAELQPWVRIDDQAEGMNRKPAVAETSIDLKGNKDLNSTDAAGLMDCGLNRQLAWDIINYRDRLGGFYMADQLLEVKQLDSLSWQLLAPCVYIDVSHIRTLSINTASYSELANHPYLSDRLARALIQYRDSTGRFRSTDEMARAYRMSPAYLEKLKFYLRL